MTRKYDKHQPRARDKNSIINRVPIEPLDVHRAKEDTREERAYRKYAKARGLDEQHIEAVLKEMRE